MESKTIIKAIIKIFNYKEPLLVNNYNEFFESSNISDYQKEIYDLLGKSNSVLEKEGKLSDVTIYKKYIISFEKLPIYFRLIEYSDITETNVLEQVVLKLKCSYESLNVKNHISHGIGITTEIDTTIKEIVKQKDIEDFIKTLNDKLL